MFFQHTAIRQGAIFVLLSALAMPVCHASHAIDVVANAVYYPKTVIQIAPEQPPQSKMTVREKHHLVADYQLISTKRRYQNKKEKKKKLMSKKRIVYVVHKPDKKKRDFLGAIHTPKHLYCEIAAQTSRMVKKQGGQNSGVRRYMAGRRGASTAQHTTLAEPQVVQPSHCMRPRMYVQNKRQR